MKRLNISLLGRSALLQALHQELTAFGHACHHTSGQALVMPGPVDVFIEDGSITLGPTERRALAQATQVSLGVSFGEEEAGLPVPTLWGWHNGLPCLHSEARTEHSGNGRALHAHALGQWTEALASLVGQLARADDPLPALAGCPRATGEITLLAFDALAYRHRYNLTAQPALLAEAEQALGARLEQSFATYGAGIALHFQGESWSYARLRATAEPVRQYVLSISSDHQQPVIGICLDKSPALFACVLGVLLAGAVYVPLDPGHPAERRHFILENSEACLLFQRNGDASLGGPWERIDPEDLAAEPLWPPAPSLPADAPCMALYTSGTTGQPKGVLLSQRNLSHFSSWYARHTSLGEGSRVLQFSTLSFDSASIDLFPTWLSGAALVVASEDERCDPARLAALIKAEAITQGFLPPALLSILPLEQVAGMHCISTGGDVCEPWVIERLARQCRFINLYGPTEATVLITARDFLPDTSNRSLGVPIANSQVWVLDEAGQPVLDGETGELYLIGPGVGLGYINNPGHTRERYVQLEVPDGSSVRAYRTGDLGRWGADGLELVGRKDNQVKIRGFRIEPEEIEGCLRDAGLCEQVAVVIEQGRRILAFVARPRAGVSSLPEALRAHVSQRLPAYMHPALFVELPTLPATPNGKVDRQALLALPGRPAAAVGNAPKTEVQRQLQQLWAELLERAPEEISTDDSFFNLGGHSIVLSRLLLELRERFGRGVSINRFIECPTIERLEQLLSEREAGSAEVVDPRTFVDAKRGAGIAALPPERLGDVHKVLVTGANGFVGVHIVAALLGWGATEVTCVVRPGGGLSGAERFEKAIVDNQLALDMARVHVLSADFTQPLLGMSAADYERIDENYGVVIHNGANVNHVMDYQSLAVDNVEPLFQLLALCEGRCKKILNFVSTLSACSAVDNSGAVLEAGPALTPPIYIRNGYNLSKWVGERILQQASDSGSFVNIFRPGNISFNSTTGVCQPHKNRLLLMLKGSLQLAAVPALELEFDLMPVDFLAKLIAFQASRHNPGVTVFNLHNPEPLTWSAYVASFEALGYGFDFIPVPLWQERLRDVGTDNALFGVLGFYLNGFEEDIGDISRIDHQNAARAIEQMGERYPRKDATLLARGNHYLQTIGFL